MARVLVYDSFDDLRSSAMRFLQEASRLGQVHALLWSDAAVRQITGRPPKFPQEERLYLVQSLRYVHSVSVTGGSIDPDVPLDRSVPDAELWVTTGDRDTARRKGKAKSLGLDYHVIASKDLAGFPVESTPARWKAAGARGAGSARTALITGCFDWFHSGHVRFFEEASGLGALYVVVGNDANLRLLKGEGHPYFSQDERRYQAASVRFVWQALVATGKGWLDAEPEMKAIKPDLYVVNEDGDRPEKREFCRESGIEYVVLHRVPRPGLPPRTSTDLRGF
jgi:cytidyltransferase-like protein